MPITPLIIRNISMVDCPKEKNRVELLVCEKCSFCKNIEDSSMIGRVFCSYPGKESEDK